MTNEITVTRDTEDKLICLISPDLSFAKAVEMAASIMLDSSQSGREISFDVSEEFPSEETFVDNGFERDYLYVRTSYAKAPSVIISKEHKHNGYGIISKGKFVVRSSSGEVSSFNAPARFTSLKGDQRIIIVLEDSVWTTFHVIPHYVGRDQVVNYLSI
jgi:hypothetical protein